jgi:hypothetical protein
VSWEEQRIPPFEAQLPDDPMPLAFFQYWELPIPNGRHNKPERS